MDTAVKFNRKNLMIAIAFLFLTAVSLSGIYVYWQLDKITKAPLDRSNAALGISPDAPGLVHLDDAPINIALFGIDQEYNDDVGRSDVIMIMTVDKRNKAIKLSSIMRDTYVYIPGYGMDKINHAYAFGGPQLAINTINSNFNMDIRDFASVSFSSMAEIIDRLGGVDINVTSEELSRIDGLCESGMQHLNGHQAVQYARIRYVGNGDYQRTERQRTVLAQIINKVYASGPDQVPYLVSQLAPYTTTSINKIDMLKMGADILSLDITSIEQLRIPVDSACEGTTINGVYYLIADLPESTEVLHKFIYSDTNAVQFSLVDANSISRS